MTLHPIAGALGIIVGICLLAIGVFFALSGPWIGRRISRSLVRWAPSQVPPRRAARLRRFLRGLQVLAFTALAVAFILGGLLLLGVIGQYQAPAVAGVMAGMAVLAGMSEGVTFVWLLAQAPKQRQ